MFTLEFEKWWKTQGADICQIPASDILLEALKTMAFRGWVANHRAVSKQDYVMSVEPDISSSIDDILGVRAMVTIELSSGDYYTLKTSGIWGIDSEKPTDFFLDIFQQECNRLTTILTSLGMEVTE